MKNTFIWIVFQKDLFGHWIFCFYFVFDGKLKEVM